MKDPSGAVVPFAAVRLEADTGSIVGTKITSQEGVTLFDDIPPGNYKVRVQREGFADAETTVAVKESGESAAEMVLKIASPETGIEVDEKASGMANADPNYRALRNAAIAESYVVENLVLRRDAGTLTFKSGTVTFTAPVLGRVSSAVFNGQGAFHLTPAMRLEGDRLALITGQPEVDEDFDSAVLLFTDSTYDELKASLKTRAESGKAADLLRDFRRHVRRHVEFPASMSEYFLQGDGVPNLDAEILTDLYNPSSAGSFSAYIHGHRHGDLRFFVKPRGAVPEMLSDEEVGLVSIDVTGSQDGVLYLTHYASEWQNGTALNHEDKRIVTPLHFRIETVIGKNTHLASVAVVKIEPLRQGDRVIHFDLLPNLRVSRVSLNGKDIGYIQESRRLDGSLYVVMPQPMEKGRAQEIQIEYQGDHVVRDEGGGNFSVQARESWYPSLNVFRDRATYDLTFKVPRQYSLVGVGKLMDRSREGDYAVSHWVADVPLAVAGFNYGDYKEKQTTDDQTKYGVEVYATEEMPAYLRQFQMTPAAMANDAMIDAENSMRCFTYWFGALPYGRIAITQQPQFNFGQSWPTLVYLPLFAFLDSTQRYMMLGQNTFSFNDFIQEVAPHEVSHQWWGHLVGWNSYHDQWLSEGFADFSAGLFLEATEKKRDKYLTYWERARKHLVEKNNYGIAPNDAGPIWMGLRLDTFKTPAAYNQLVYPKGGFVPHMLRYLMQDANGKDTEFIAMMHDFTSTYAGMNASTEDFKRIVEKHMTPAMNLDGNNRMDWFFQQFVYGTEIGSYHLTYLIAPQPDGKYLFTGKITQSGVTGRFRVRMPIYVDFGKGAGPVKMVNVGVAGNSDSPEIKVPLPLKPKKILLNYNYDVLARETSVEER